MPDLFAAYMSLYRIIQTPDTVAIAMEKIHDTRIIPLDGRPALDVLKEDVGEKLARDMPRLGATVFAGLPVAGTDTGDYLVRNLV